MTTIGVAVAVPDPWAEQLQSYRTDLGDSTAQGIPTHITLVPPYAAGPDSIATIEDHLAGAAAGHRTFKVHLRGTGTFRPTSPVVFVVVVEGISDCEVLAAAVRRGPLAIDLQFPYHPHVTVAHQVSEERLDRAFAELSGFECEFEVDHFSLYLHDDQEGWRRTRDFPLLPAPMRTSLDGNTLRP